MATTTTTTRRQTATPRSAIDPAAPTRRPFVLPTRKAAVVGAFAIVGLAYWGYQTFAKDMPEAERASGQFLELLKVGYLDDQYTAQAYAATSSQFREQHSEETFRRFARDVTPALRGATRDLVGISVSTTPAGKVAVVEYTLRSGPRTRACTVKPLSEGGEWKAFGVEVGPETR